MIKPTGVLIEESYLHFKGHNTRLFPLFLIILFLLVPAAAPPSVGKWCEMILLLLLSMWDRRSFLLFISGYCDLNAIAWIRIVCNYCISALPPLPPTIAIACSNPNNAAVQKLWHSSGNGWMKIAVTIIATERPSLGVLPFTRSTRESRGEIAKKLVSHDTKFIRWKQ